MFSTRTCSKSVSCESLFYERSSLKRKLIPSTTPNNISFKNEDYNYLINCNELIMTCKEALLENESPVIAALTDFAISDSVTNKNQQNHQLNNNKKTQKLQKNSFDEFVKWLRYTEFKLDSVCYCANKNKNNKKLLSKWEDIVNHHKALQSEIENVGRRFINELKSSVKESKEIKEEIWWHTLWLKSFEYLMIVEQGKHCPQHYNNNNNNNGNSNSNSNSVDEQLVPSKKPKNNVGIAASDTKGIKNKRVQTKTTMVGETKNELLGNIKSGTKIEIIQKDIGYSSDADMSDAVEAQPQSDENNINRNVRKRQIRRRRSRVPRTRPWSFHADWTDWDYYQTPLNYGDDYNLSTEYLYFYEDDNTVKNLIEFGENYETWISNEDDDLIRVSSPVLSHATTEKEPKIQEPLTQEVPFPSTNNNNDNIVTLKIEKRSSSMHFGLKLFIYAVALTIFLIAISMANYSPHIEKAYPHRPPPI